MPSLETHREMSSWSMARDWLRVRPNSNGSFQIQWKLAFWRVFEQTKKFFFYLCRQRTKRFWYCETAYRVGCEHNKQHECDTLRTTWVSRFPMKSNHMLSLSPSESQITLDRYEANEKKNPNGFRIWNDFNLSSSSASSFKCLVVVFCFIVEPVDDKTFLLIQLVSEQSDKEEPTSTSPAA